MSTDDDPWLGEVLNFPKVLHSQQVFNHEADNTNLQTAILSALRIISSMSLPIELSLSDRDGYLPASAKFRLGVGNAEAFDIYDEKEHQRLLQRIQDKGPFAILDLSFNVSYLALEREKKLAAREDRFLARLMFRSGRMEMYVHHLQGMRRVRPGELVDLFVEQVNAELRRSGHPYLTREDSRANHQTRQATMRTLDAARSR